MTTFGAQPGPGALQLEGEEATIVLLEDVTEMGQPAVRVLGGDGQPIVVRTERAGAQPARRTVTVLQGAEDAAGVAPGGPSDLERLRAEMEALKRQLKELLEALDKR